MRLPENEIVQKARVGTYLGRPAYQVVGVGGYHAVFGADGEILGVGPVLGAARWVAKQRGVKFDDLQKSVQTPYAAYADMVPIARAWTDQARLAAR